MKKLLLFFLLTAASVAAQSIIFPAHLTIGPGFAPMQRGSVMAPVQPGWASAAYAVSFDGVDDAAEASGDGLVYGTASRTIMYLKLPLMRYRTAPQAILHDFHLFEKFKMSLKELSLTPNLTPTFAAVGQCLPDPPGVPV